MSIAARFRRLLESERPLVAPGAYDAVSARLVERAGFQAVYLTGYGAVASMLGLPDVGLATLTEMADHAARVAAAVSVPVLADGDTGHGSVLSVQRTVRAFERAGVAGIHVEDQVSPKRCGHMADKQVVGIPEMLGRLRAALDARVDPDFVIVARTDAIGPEGFESAVERAQRYLEVGADLAFLEAPTTLEQVHGIPRLVGGPCLFNAVLSGSGAVASVADLAASGYRLVIYPTAALWTATRAVSDLLAELQQHGDLARLGDRMLGFAEFDALMGLADLQARADRYG